MLDGHVFPATHAAVVCAGTDVVSSFVFDDGMTQARGVAVVMTPVVVRTTLSILADLKQKVQALAETPTTSEMIPPGEYVLDQEPVSVHSLAAVFADDSETLVLGFRSIDLDETYASMEDGRGQIATKLAMIVALSAPKVLGWMAALDGAIVSKAVDRE